MSVPAQSPTRAAPSLDKLLIGAILAAVIGIFWYAAGQQQQNLRHSPTGLDGLAIWLRDHDQITRNFAGGWVIDPDTVGLRLLPLYDSDITAPRIPPKTQQELLFQQDEYDQKKSIVVEKIKAVPTLVILPKWRSGVRLTGLAHPALLVNPARTQDVLHAIAGAKVGRLQLAEQAFTDVAWSGSDDAPLNARFYAAQTFEGLGCTPVLGEPGQMILGKCPVPGSDPQQDVLILSDIDLLSNHGMRLGDNAEIAHQLLDDLAGENQVLIDYSRDVWVRKTLQSKRPERTWEDLARFFEYPFSILWVGSVILMGLFLWRAAVRYGPIQRAFSDGPGASKTVSIDARAHLLRLADQDGSLVGDYVETRIATVAVRLFGPQLGLHGGAEPALLRLLNRTAPQDAARLQQLLSHARALPATTSANEAIGFVHEFERLLESIDRDT